jgi:hypothetical protein
VGDYFRELAAAIAASPLDEATRDFLSSFRGMAPMIQTVHILAVSAVMGSIVLIDLRILGLALRRQHVPEMVRRLMPWMWYPCSRCRGWCSSSPGQCGMPTIACSG